MDKHQPVGGFNPVKKNVCRIGSFPQKSGWNQKIPETSWNHHPVNNWLFHHVDHQWWQCWPSETSKNSLGGPDQSHPNRTFAQQLWTWKILGWVCPIFVWLTGKPYELELQLFSCTVIENWMAQSLHIGLFSDPLLTYPLVSASHLFWP